MTSGPQGLHTFKTRWLRERKRSPAIATVKIGDTLTVTYPKRGGAEHRVTCCDGYYVYNEVQYPTLYKVVEAIAGAHERPNPESVNQTAKRTANFSAPRFFGLTDRTATTPAISASDDPTA